MYSNFQSEVKFDNYLINEYYLDACKKLANFNNLIGDITIPIIEEDLTFISEEIERFKKKPVNDLYHKYEIWHLFTFSYNKKNKTWICVKYEVKKYKYVREEITYTSRAKNHLNH